MAIKFADSPCSKYICEIVLIVMCLFCITVRKLGIKVIIIFIILLDVSLTFFSESVEFSSVKKCCWVGQESKESKVRFGSKM